MSGGSRIRHDRTRSPRGSSHRDLNGFISRAIAGFGRYEQNRPPGLQFNESGDMKLDSLIQCWAQDEGLTKEEVLSAVNASMFTDATKTSRRFEILGEPSSDLYIRVFESHKGRRRFESRHGFPERDPAIEQLARRRMGSHRREHSADSLLQLEGESRGPDDAAPAQPLRHVARVAERLPDEPEVDQHSSRSRPDRRDRFDRRASTRHTRSIGEEVQRWLGWVLKRGYREMGLKLKDGEWISIESAAEEIKIAKRRLGIRNAQDLENVICDSDEAGRFEIADGYLRKVPRDERGGPSAISSANMAAPVAITAAQDSMETDEVLHLDRGSRNQTRANHEEVLPAEGILEVPPPRERPGRPPGDHWNKFNDKGVIWFYYEGPLGKWWFDEEMTEPEPYDEDG